MKIALIGATGFVGSEVLKEALTRGHEVTAIARNTENIAEAHLLKKVDVDVKNIEKLANAVKDSEVVISAFNPGWSNPNIYNDYLEGAKAIQQAVKKAGVKRLIVVGGAGSLFLNERTRVIDSPNFPEEIKPGATAASEYLEILKREKELDWTFFSPAIGMAPGKPQERRNTYRKGFEKPVFDEDGKSELSVQDTAVVLVDEAENAAHINQRFTAAY
ncbi:NAD(P)-dependent oxidoreductase [Salegentibacter sp. BDJ18]|uniref:NAD(P)-dependent oxidoreductase n=1 Tax=Salegentibacter sp. BDJ18 TaxID=2816376 RepID=UPI001AAE21C4|nr:NAD(P)-dependent oxidoreductase [Salegentibacter sp. BDJ18]MBO2545689.1 NAD(P)-dependent oxidoreductase [Salegentibacter sp. BDJ18]